jgi:general secretion pathway protein J
MSAPGFRPRRTQGGFTLLEVLIGTTLLGVMMLLLTGSLRIGAESWDAGEERIARASRMFVVQNFLRNHIGSLLPVAGTARDGRMEPAFRGAPDALEYVAPLPEQVKTGGLYRFQLYVSKNGEHKDLRMTILPYLSGPDQGKAVEPIDDLAVLENIKDIKLSYLPRVFPGQNPMFQRQEIQWTDEWKNNQLPALIRVDIETENEEPWPTLVIAPRTLVLR